MIIYKVTNLVNNKCYIGKTITTLNNRISQHKADIKRGKIYYFQRALIKYGFGSFDWEILEECDTLDKLNELEIHYIQLFNSQNRELGYNVAAGGSGGGNRNGAILSRETKEKISEAKRGKLLGSHSEETKKKISNANKGREFSTEHKKKLSIARCKRITTDETRKRMSSSSKGKVNIKQYTLIDPDGNRHFTPNGLSAFCEAHGLITSNMHKVLTGKRRSHMGWSAPE